MHETVAGERPVVAVETCSVDISDQDVALWRVRVCQLCDCTCKQQHFARPTDYSQHEVRFKRPGVCVPT